MRAVVVDVICGMLALLVESAYAAADAGLARIVLSERTGIGKHSLKELDRNDLLTVVHHRVDTGHADVLDHAKVSEVFLTESHPETCTFDCRVMFHQ